MDLLTIFVENVKVLARLILVYCITLTVILLFELDRGLIIIGAPGLIAYLVAGDDRFNVPNKKLEFVSFFKCYLISVLVISIYVYCEIFPLLQPTSVMFKSVSVVTIVLSIFLCFTGAFYGLKHGQKLVDYLFKPKTSSKNKRG